MLWLIVFWDLPCANGITTSTIRHGDNHAGSGGDDDAFIDRHIDGVDADGIGNDGQSNTGYRRGNRVGVIDGAGGCPGHDNADLGNPANRCGKVRRGAYLVSVDSTGEILRRVIQSVDALNAVLLGG